MSVGRGICGDSEGLVSLVHTHVDDTVLSTGRGRRGGSVRRRGGRGGSDGRDPGTTCPVSPSFFIVPGGCGGILLHLEKEQVTSVQEDRSSKAENAWKIRRFEGKSTHNRYNGDTGIIL